MLHKLFVYGTLHPDRAPSEISKVVQRLEPMGKGTIRAKLYRFPEYPAIHIDSKNGSRISGQVFRISNPTDLKELDEYEEYHPDALSKSLFRRKRVTVKMQDGSKAECWVYEYNRTFPKAGQRRPATARPPVNLKTEPVLA